MLGCVIDACLVRREIRRQEKRLQSQMSRRHMKARQGLHVGRRTVKDSLILWNADLLESF